MKRLLIVLSLPMAASAAEANTLGCGDNAYTYAEVVTRPPGVRARGPIVSMPESLCADLIEARPRGVDSLSVHIGEPRSPIGGSVGKSGAPGRLPDR
jgi:hypothetical protein